MKTAQTPDSISHLGIDNFTIYIYRQTEKGKGGEWRHLN